MEAAGAPRPRRGGEGSGPKAGPAADPTVEKPGPAGAAAAVAHGRLSDAEQEWILGVCSAWILFPVGVLLVDTWLGRPLGGGSAWLSDRLALEQPAPVFAALWCCYGRQCRRVLLDRAGAVVLSGFYLLCAWGIGGSVCVASLMLIVGMVAGFGLTFALSAGDSEYLLPHLSFRYCGFLLALIVCEGFDACWVVASVGYWVSCMMMKARARRLFALRQLWRQYGPMSAWCLTCVVATLFVGLALKTLSQHFAYAGSDAMVPADANGAMGLLSGVLAGVIIALLSVLLTGEVPCGSEACAGGGGGGPRPTSWLELAFGL